MAQKNNHFTSFWMDTTIAPGTPLTGLSATINIRDLSGNLVVNNEPMTELGGGHYMYTFNGYNPAIDYVYDCNPGSIAYRESGVTNNIEKLISEINVGGGGFSSQSIQTSIGNAKREIISKIEEMPKIDILSLQKSLNEIDSHIELAKSETIDTIKTSETEICSDIIRKSKDLEESNVKTRQLVRQKTKKIDENVSKLADRQEMIDKTIEDEADEIEDEIEQLLNEEADMIEDEIYNMEADEIEKDITNQSNDGNSESNS